MSTEPTPHAAQGAPRWRPITALDRRVLGVLVEKAKTTPEAYPMSVNALRTGCNQKNNRFPLMEVEVEDVEESLMRLREMGAATEVQGGGRVLRYRHYLYDWMGVDKVELAVMAELLLRGAQTEGDLRGRAGRMEPIADLAALRPVLVSLKAKKLVVPLTAEGRGHVVTHALYEPRELEKILAEFSAASPAGPPTTSIRPTQPQPANSPVAATASRPIPAERSTAVATSPITSAPASRDIADANQASLAAEIAQLKRGLTAVQDVVAQLRKDLEDLWASLR